MEYFDCRAVDGIARLTCQYSQSCIEVNFVGISLEKGFHRTACVFASMDNINVTVA